MIEFAVLALVIIGVVVAVNSRGSFGNSFDTDAAQRPPSVAIDTVRLLQYGVAFIGLMGILFSVMGLIGIGLAQTIFASHNLISADDARTQVSYYLAALIVATPLWLGFWRLIQRRIDRSPEEGDAPERRLYFALIFAVTSVVSLFAAQTVLRVIFTLPGPHNGDAALRDGVSALIQLLVYGIACLYYARVTWRERSATVRDPARDLSLYVLTGYSLAFLSIGAINLLAALLDRLIQGQYHVLLGDSSSSLWNTLGNGGTWVVTGGAVFAAVSYLDATYPGVRPFRIPYLYVVFAVAGPVTVGYGTNVLYELLRRLFGYRPDTTWSFLHDSLPPLIVAAAIWAYYWSVMRRQAALSRRESGSSMIPWPRRPYLAILSVVGLAMAAFGAVTVIWVALDFLFGAHATLTGSDWWRDQLSIGIAVLAAGALLWLRPWGKLQVAAQASPRERGERARRWLLGAVVLAATLIGVGFLIAMLWLVFRLVLGGPHDSDTVTSIFKYFTTAVIAGGIAIYHAAILRGDTRAGSGKAARLRITVLLTPDATEAVVALTKRLDHDIEVAGYLAADVPQTGIALDELDQQLEAIAATGTSRALLVLHRDRAVLYPYNRSRPAAVPGTAEDPGPQIAATTG